MSKKLTKSPTEVKLRLPIQKGTVLVRDFIDYAASQPVSKEGSFERDPQNTPEQFFNNFNPDFLQPKRLVDLLEVPPERSSEYNPTTNKSSDRASSNPKPKPAKRNNIKPSTPSHKREIDFSKTNDGAKIKVARMLSRESQGKPKHFRDFSLTGNEINKTQSTSYLRGNSSEKKLDTHTESNKKAKLRQLNFAYNDSSLADLSKVMNQTHAVFNSQNFKISSHSPENRSSYHYMPMTTTNKGSGSKINFNAISAHHTPNGSMTNLTQTIQQAAEIYKAGKARPRHKKVHSIGSTSGLNKEGNVLSTHYIVNQSPKHRKVISNGGQGFLFNNSVLQNSLNNSNYHSGQTKSQNTSTMMGGSEVNHNYKDNFLLEKEILESRIDGFLRRKDTSRDHLDGLKTAFDTVIENCNNEAHAGQQNAILLKKIKRGFEQFIDNIIAKEQTSNRENIDDKEHIFNECLRLKDEKAKMEKEMLRLKVENEKLQTTVFKLKTTGSSSQSQTALSTEKKQHHDSQYDSPPVTKHAHVNVETDNLKQIILRQQAAINAMKKKEAKMIRLLIAIRKTGLDIEQIYNEEVKGKYDSLGDEPIPTFEKFKSKKGSLPDNQSSAGENSSVPSENNSGKDINRIMNDIEIQEVVQNKTGKQLTEPKNINDSLPPTHPTLKSTHNNLNPALRNKLKLDLSAVRQKTTSVDSKAPSIDGHASNNQQDDQQLGFHDEFMARLDEFSLSWRQAAMQEKKH